MPIFNLFSKRQKILRGDVPDTLSHDKISEPLRIRIIHIIRDAFGPTNGSNDLLSSDIYFEIKDTLCREYGLFFLPVDKTNSIEEHVLNFLLTTPETEKALDVIELSFKLLDTKIRSDYNHYRFYAKPKIGPDEAIDELNKRFKEEGIGYCFESGEIIKIDSTYIHSEITKPTLALISNKKFLGANDEYLTAHEHYRHGRNKECLAECLKAFESTLKIICKEKGWNFKETDTSKKLIQICFDNELVPAFTQNQFTSLRSLLESGIPTLRNKLGGHGQGQTPKVVDDEMTRYALNLTGTNIIFLVELSKVN
ncbi:abortive infection family protein [Cyclobacterium jeungdonense]|uniref:Abortive infection family protein n=1 Tax=Cyclobacterium jeungdonense TaxID=708087 RepID=A0ABT8C8F0_9BACT|nr:abortive infection family protein [Cyclobacterium jeungdonense]MDN3688671.1 abortive infection family protein [Cyclobacterium jeungdonense]